ncbi:MAG: isochorismate synthase [Chromatiaceae bacterium]|nr:MAG: isochorismate synthase [Chromatiaceae bacterium]
MQAPLDLTAQLTARMAAALARLPGTGDTGLVSLVLALPRAPTAVPPLTGPDTGPQFQLLRVHQGGGHAGFGIAAEWQAQGPRRLHQLAAAAAWLRQHWQRHDPDETGLDAFALLGFAATGEALPPEADHLPNALLWVPSIGVRQHQDGAALVLSARLPASRATLQAAWGQALTELVPRLYQPVRGPLPPARLVRHRSEPDRAAWADLVGNALAQIERGAFAKVVLSRRLELSSTRQLDLGRLLGALTCLFPSCQIIHLRRNGASFVAATPERLLARRGNLLEVDAIAGTAARASDAEQDQALAAALLGSDKNLREHRFVIDAIRAALTPCCSGIEVPARPEVMQLSNAHHLWSPIRARTDPRRDCFELADLLHPTPATNGQPRHAASAWLRQHEPCPRGWYTGAAGIIEPDRNGELWVLLRCARVCGARAELYAGAGIVAGSDPDSEWEETEAKLGAMLSALQYA